MMKTFPLDLALCRSIIISVYAMHVDFTAKAAIAVCSSAIQNGPCLALASRAQHPISPSADGCQSRLHSEVSWEFPPLPLPRMRLLFPAAPPLPPSVVQCIQLGVCPRHSKHGMEDGGETGRGKGGRERGENSMHIWWAVGWLQRLPRCKMGRPASPAKLPLSGWTDSQSEEQGARTTGSRTVAWCDKVERSSNFASSSCRMRNAQLFLKVQRAWPSSSSTMPLFIHALKGGKLFWYGWRRFSGYTI